MATDRLRKKIGKGRHASAIKRAKQDERRRADNRAVLSKMKTAIKAVRTAKSKEALRRAVPVLIKGARKGVIHRRKASRLVSRLTRLVNAQKA
jgi:small subunit ribosomal protein S20